MSVPLSPCRHSTSHPKVIEDALASRDACIGKADTGWYRGYGGEILANDNKC